MVYYALRACILFLSGYFVFLKIAKKTNLIRPKYELLYVLGMILVSSVAFASTHQVFLSIYIFGIQIISFVVFKFLYQMKWSTAYIVTTITYGIVHGFLFASSLLVALVLNLTGNKPPESSWVASAIKIAPVCCNFLILYGVFRIRRLRSGFPFLQELRIIDVSVVMSNIILMFSTVMCVADHTYILAVIYCFSASVFLFATYLLWKRRIRAKYIRALKQQEIAAVQATIREQAERLQILTEENRKLSEIIHRDNKLIPAMELSVRTYLQSDGQDHTLGTQLLEQLSALTAERKGILTQYERDGETIRRTGYAAVDIVLEYMHQKAKQEKVCFQTDFADFEAALKRQKIEDADIKTILADLIENAIIACRESAHKQVYVYIGTIRNSFMIRVFDSGVPFEFETLRKIGIEPTTTHADSNGSGIGMQSLFSIKKKYACSILIHEHIPDQSIFTKSIAVIFNRFNQFIIRSYRAGQIRNMCPRSDMILETDENIQNQTPATPISA